MLSSLDKKIIGLAIGIPEHMTRRELCPKCTGGSGSEKSLDITRMAAGLLFYCQRASCHHKGFISLIGPAELDPVPRPRVPIKFTPRTLTDDLGPLMEDDYDFFLAEFEIPPSILEECGVANAFTEFSHRYLYPVHGPRGRFIGYNTRTYNKIIIPKLLTYRYEDFPWMAWYINKYNEDLVFVVEDQVSAMKIYSLGFNAIALLGTTVNDEKMNLIGTYFKNVCLMLDKDATYVSLSAMQKYCLFFNKFIAVTGHTKDPKNIPKEELRTLLRAYRKTNGVKITKGDSG